MSLAKIIDREFLVLQFVTPDNKVYRIIEQHNGLPVGIQNMKTKVIEPYARCKKLYNEYRNQSLVN